MAETKVNKRVTYPLSAQDVEELTGLEKNLKSKADEAEKNNKVGLHRAYMALMRSTTRTVTRERNRMAREELAARNRRQKEMQERAKNGTGAPNPTIDNSAA